jgi:hypothetical protein
MPYPKLTSSLLVVYLLTLILALSTLTGCGQNASSLSNGDLKDIVTTLNYGKDPRTNLCYAAVASRTSFKWKQNGFTITYVPCTPEVLAQIAK